MQLVLQLAVFRMGMTPAEALVSSTINAAFAIGKIDRGVISEGWRADLLVCDVPDYRHLTYHFGINHVEKVCLLYTSPSPRDGLLSRMPSSA